MRILGIDYGTKKVGLALTDEDGLMAFPYEVIKNDDAFLNVLTRLCEEKDVKEIVIGHSLHPSGEDNKVQEAITELIGDLTLELGLPVHLEPEQYTTKEAERIQGKGEKVDASAAAIILNSFLGRSTSK